MRVRVLGAGIVGLAVADELVRRGHHVQLVDPTPVSGASHAAAGMLAPGAEVWWGEEELLRLGAAALERWPRLAADLGVRLDLTGTLLVGHDAGDRDEVERQAALVERLGRPVRRLSRRDLQQREPAIGRVAGAVVVPGEGSVDPRAVCTALLHRLAAADVVPRPDADAAPPYDVVVVATGATLPPPWRGLLTRVRGEIVRLRSDDAPRGVVRGWVHGRAVYLVPRGDGRVVLGATSEEHAGAPVVTAGGVHALLEAGRTLWPALDRAELVETTARDRPATADGLPLVGPTRTPGVLLAAGHHRHGVLLAPLTAHLVAEHLATGAVDPAVDPRRLLPLAEHPLTD